MTKTLRRMALLLALILSLNACGPAPIAARIANGAQVVAAIRHGLRFRSSCITLRFSAGTDMSAQIPALAEEWVEAALAETWDPAGGDYIRYQYGGYTLETACDTDRGRYDYTVALRPVYYSYLAEEEAVAAQVRRLLEDFAFTAETSDYEKLRTVYDYVCQTVAYDKVHRKNPYYHKKSTAYSALIGGTATCQGYAAAVYRLLRASGVPCRIVTGMSEGEFHAWNIAAAEGLWYSLDATWDAGAETYQYFLRGSGDGHRPDPRFTTPEFQNHHPMAEEDYAPAQP